VKIRKDLLQAVDKGHSYNHYKSHNTKKSTELPKSVEKKDEKKSGIFSSKVAERNKI
jgi:endonuclease YncB( thermonuclease family)